MNRNRSALGSEETFHQKLRTPGPVTVVVIRDCWLAFTAAEAAAEKVFRRANDLSYGGKESLDPISATRFYEVNDMVYSRLVRQDDNGEPAAELATAWTTNDTATEWTITLRSGVTFHDGSTFDAADVKYTLERIKDPTLESPLASVLDFIERVASSDVEKLEIEKKFKVSRITEIGYQGITINIGKSDRAKNNPLGRDARVREAFELSLDRQGLAQVVMDNEATVGNQWVAPKTCPCPSATLKKPALC